MASYTVEITRSRPDDGAHFLQVFGEVGREKMTVLVNAVQADAQVLSPVDRGLYRGSIQNSVDQAAPTSIQGSVFSSSAYAEVIELGRAPGRFPPVDAMIAWVARVINPPANQIKSIAFLVGRAIAQRGIPAKRPIGRAVDQNQALADRLLTVELPNEVARRL